jgi:hypothetical protein
MVLHNFKKLRKLIVDNQTFGWRYQPGYERSPVSDRVWQCHDIFTAYQVQYRRSPLRIHFVTWESAVSGGPLRSGDPVNLDNPNSGGINLHQPKFATELIRQALKSGWKPDTDSRPYLIDDGIKLLADLGYDIA